MPTSHPSSHQTLMGKKGGPEVIGQFDQQYAQLRQQELIREAEKNRLAARIRQDSKSSAWNLILRALALPKPVGA
jgi:hypothetical protein